MLPNRVVKTPVTDEIRFLALRIWVDRSIETNAGHKIPFAYLYRISESWITDQKIETVGFKKPVSFSKALTRVLGVVHTRQGESTKQYVGGMVLSEGA